MGFFHSIIWDSSESDPIDMCDVFDFDGRYDVVQVCFAIQRVGKAYNVFFNKTLRIAFLNSKKCSHGFLHFCNSRKLSCMGMTSTSSVLYR